MSVLVEQMHRLRPRHQTTETLIEWVLWEMGKEMDRPRSVHSPDEYTETVLAAEEIFRRCTLVPKPLFKNGDKVQIISSQEIGTVIGHPEPLFHMDDDMLNTPMDDFYKYSIFFDLLDFDWYPESCLEKVECTTK